MTPQEMLRDDYERELRYLREAGAAFARKHPAIAARLELSADESPDPHVERLLEGFAFLAARLQRRIDESVSEVAANLLEQLHPHAVRPLPSASIARFDVEQAKVDLAGGYRVERGTQLYAATAEGETVYLRTCYPVTLWPLSVARVDLLTERLDALSDHPAMRGVLAVRLAYPADFDPAGVDLGPLRFHVSGNSPAAASLCDLLYGHVLEVRWRGPDRRSHPLPGALPRFVGLADDEALLPERPDTHSGLRLLLEYFAMPHKFQFFEQACAGLGGGAAWEPGQPRWCELLFVLDERPAAALDLAPDLLQLGCTPVINLFARTSEPVRITGTRTEYKLVADVYRERATEIYSIEEVTSLVPAEQARTVPPCFGWHGTGVQAGRVFWHARRGPPFKPAARGSDMLLTFVSPHFDPTVPAERTLVARLLCTNRGMAESLSPGTPLHLEDMGPVAAVRLLHRPTPQSDSAPTGAARWKLVSQLSLNQLSLAEGPQALDALKELLALNNLTGSVVADGQIAALAGLRCRRVTRHVGDDPWLGYRHGYALALRLAPGGMHGSSELLFGALLQHFLTVFAGINTFVELVLEHADGSCAHRWQAQTVSQLPL
ncbi:type VI secretion system baseplate subunit TssF [Pseudoduganella buxea]|uniref:Type VI secretion system baseplate subunit TssF n=1 Tax=Pseudoduganella buxea TaxID=1949069 RepID=A0A6I3T5I8_9BURK|nr:type VI secretion system baseplate subunit TssF [Pseudoduganella buxea]MTV55732.1 type VI secretion system baseplate subunit TssF [Pseudoduganella buxea]GGC13450.1 hypothetical protein GCM10011572_38570 [Pseudoduganella buxea]